MRSNNLPEKITSAYLVDVLVIQSEMLRRLSKRGMLGKLEIGNLMDDIGHSYIDIAEAIRRDALNARREYGPYPSLHDETAGVTDRAAWNRD